MSGEANRRLDRVAQRLGVAVAQDGATREFQLTPSGRKIRYKQQGKGSFVVEAYVGDRLEATTVCGEDRIERLLLRAAREMR